MAKKVNEDLQAQEVEQDLDQGNLEQPEQAGQQEQAKQPEQPKQPEQAELKAISVLSVKYRLASWQLAALLRLMDWQDDKQVNEAEFINALAALTARPLGGNHGRRI